MILKASKCWKKIKNLFTSCIEAEIESEPESIDVDADFDIDPPHNYDALYIDNSSPEYGSKLGRIFTYKILFNDQQYIFR